MPELSRSCNETTKCEYQWFSSQWSKCSVECGKGVQTRNVFCGKLDKNSVKLADSESKCKSDEKPENTKECDTEKKCEGQWFEGPWGDCSKKCGGGKRTRKVLCIAEGNAVAALSKCGEESISYSQEDCNKAPCLEDEIIPIDTTAKSIEEDYDDEECEDEDEEFKLITTPEDSSQSTVDTTTEFESSSSSSSWSIDEELMQSDSAFSTDEFSDGTKHYCKHFF